jgi:hypothetical protein
MSEDKYSVASHLRKNWSAHEILREKVMAAIEGRDISLSRTGESSSHNRTHPKSPRNKLMTKELHTLYKPSQDIPLVVQKNQS